jgi:SAM-dependent methyltransferase
MLKKEEIAYFNYSRNENKKFWKRVEEVPNFKNKSVLDFGCGHGALSIDIALLGAKFVHGIDLEDKPLEFANKNLIKNYKHLNNIKFQKLNILDSNINQKFDYVVSKDTFEHTNHLPEVLQKIYNILNVGGRAYLGFGPLYNFYNGDHGRLNMYLPWFHLLFKEKFLINRINKKENLNIKTIQDLGLSKYSFAEYKKFFKNSSFKILFFKTNLSDNPISFVFNVLSKIKILQEFCTYNIYCILEK